MHLGQRIIYLTYIDTMISLRKLIKEHRIFTILVVSFICVRVLYSVTRYHLPSWDEAVYLGMGKYLYSAGAVGLWENIRPIAWPLLTGLVWKLGFNQLIASEALMLLMASGCLILTYIIALRAFDKKTAVIASIIMSMTPVFFIHSGYFFTEIPSLLFVLLAVFFITRDKPIYAGMAAGSAFLFKFPQGIALLIVGIALCIRLIIVRHRSLRSFMGPFARLSIGFAVILVPFLFFNYVLYHAYWPGVNAIIMPLVRASEHQANIYQSVFYTLGSHDWWAYLINVLYYPLIIAKQQFIVLLCLVALFYYIPARWYRNPDQNLIMISFLVYIIYLTWILNKQERFLPLFLPFVCILAATVLRAEMPLSWKRLTARRILFGMLFIGSLLCAALHIYSEWRVAPSGEPDIVSFYRYFDQSPISGQIQTTDPVFSVYSNRKYIPVYDTMDPGTLFVNRWQQTEPADAIVYCESAFPCFRGDEKCQYLRTQKFLGITANRTLIKNITYEDVTFLVYINASAEVTP
jgi:hypothetical protein